MIRVGVRVEDVAVDRLGPDRTERPERLVDRRRPLPCGAEARHVRREGPAPRDGIRTARQPSRRREADAAEEDVTRERDGDGRDPGVRAPVIVRGGARRRRRERDRRVRHVHGVVVGARRDGDQRVAEGDRPSGGRHAFRFEDGVEPNRVAGRDGCAVEVRSIGRRRARRRRGRRNWGVPEGRHRAVIEVHLDCHAAARHGRRKRRHRRDRIELRTRGQVDLGDRHRHRGVHRPGIRKRRPHLDAAARIHREAGTQEERTDPATHGRGGEVVRARRPVLADGDLPGSCHGQHLRLDPPHGSGRRQFSGSATGQSDHHDPQQRIRDRFHPRLPDTGGTTDRGCGRADCHVSAFRVPVIGITNDVASC